LSSKILINHVATKTKLFENKCQSDNISTYLEEIFKNKYLIDAENKFT